MPRKFTDADADAVRAAQAALFGATAAADRPDDGSHNWLRDRCRDWLNRQAGVCVWNNDAAPRHGTPGTSDLIGWRAGLCFKIPQGAFDSPAAEAPTYARYAQFVAVEIKRRRDTERVKQSGFLRDVNAAGGIGIVVRDDLQDLVTQWKERADGSK